MTVEPAFQEFLDRLHAAGVVGAMGDNPEQTRAAMAAAAGQISAPRASDPFTEEWLTVESTGVKVLVVRPRPQPAACPTVAYFHGGAFVAGSAELTAPVARHLCRTLNAVVVSGDYRLAPEHPFPAAVEDAWSVVEWMFENVATLGGDLGRIAVCGESAGANLSAVCALQARDRARPLAAQMLIVPGTDFTRRYPSAEQFGDGYFLTNRDYRLSAEYYFGADPEAAASPLHSPALAEDHSGVAPAVIGVAGCDPLRDDGIAYAGLLLRAGVPTELRIYPTLIHPFFGMAEMSAVSEAAASELIGLFSARIESAAGADVPISLD